MRYYQYLSKENNENIVYDDEVEKLQRKGSLNSLSFNGELSDEENAFIILGDEDAKADKNTSGLRKKIVFSVICIIISLLLNIGKFTIPNTPALVQMEFSAFPELAATLVVNPLAGCLVVLIKNLLYYFVSPNAVASILNKIILDILFVLIAGYGSKLLMKTKGNKRWLKNREDNKFPYREYSFVSVFASGVISTGITTVASVFTLKYVLLPVLYRYFSDKGFTPENIFKSYQIAYEGLPKAASFIKSIFPIMDSLKTGVIVYNIPLTLLKYFICTVLAILTYFLANSIINKE
ncbi:MAG: hypothetical protein E7570_00780 [Ruminococcaceae bacterium]|nr:hypothetical protein [Oscillospiraceae bacterium]